MMDIYDAAIEFKSLKVINNKNQMNFLQDKKILLQRSQ